ncbi:DUF2442 domain-containing protein [Pontiella sulfatireligans]|uniref:DUF2442 domain-containing protein n=1 Tax=Pontiella sulfatireligans TaxID=2750658 RepID=A0A6C2UQ57_9BACT|nr:DUF2442 domain-containing protein [Pontiella sulfatireligans]VGO21411.1 hypothetical protein SCARR_03484 [Pontiella sulfatireligans]
MNYDVVTVEHVDGLRLKLSFADGASGEVDFKPFIDKGGVFSVLLDVEQFKLYSIDPDWNTITWNDGELDIAPETLYFEATGAWPNKEQILNVAETPPEYGSSSSK